MVDNLAIEKRLYELVKDYFQFHGVEIKNLYDEVEVEDKVGIFAGISYTEDALPQHDIEMDASGFFRSTLIVRIKTYALDDKRSESLWEQIKTVRGILHRQGLARLLNEFATDHTVLAVLTGPSNTGIDGNIRLFDFSYTVIHSAHKEAQL